ncbi:hypothetical protein C1646_752773 [Rhizophagus diaphanus]|nr:hypothetical protein C1646_752773 [Rhizophagus diaphanus] [Rhizophagus sp. MUCL 43196]
MFFSSDEASVMLGKNNSVATKLANKNPYLFKHIIFFSNSEKRIETLRNFQTILDHSTLKIKNIFEIRWLSWYEAVKNYLIELSKIFQSKFIIFSNINPIINSTIQKIEHKYLEVDDDGKQKLSIYLNNFLSKVSLVKDSFIDHILFKSQDKIDLQVDIMDFATAPKNKESLNDYKKKELEELIGIYGVANAPNYLMLIIDANTICDEWDNFKAIILANYKNLLIDDLLPLLF